MMDYFAKFILRPFNAVAILVMVSLVGALGIFFEYERAANQVKEEILVKEIKHLSLEIKEISIELKNLTDIVKEVRDSQNRKDLPRRDNSNNN